ncbi:MAG: 1-acyl-sn-glycerol-3-phosphate acyltransferase [Bacteroidia bacterium]|nr:1-acyl-sn-glycerol-3-phosphate acyltransferase [Bacteroidia bacterium]
MKRKLHTFYYNTLKALIAFALRMFYRRHEVDGYKENVPKGKPVIFAGNHQNALIDALNVVCTTSRDRQPTFMTRSDIFLPKLKPIFNTFKMLPIYRQQDGVDTLQKNEEIFATCIRRLSRKEALIIFPEGNHNRQRRLRPLKKGTARIAFLAEEANDFQLGTCFVPVGLNYSNHLHFRGDLYVKYGKPINTEDYYEEYQTNPQRTLIKITQVISDGMRDSILHIANKENYETIESLRMMYEVPMTRKAGLNPRRLRDVFDSAKKLIDVIERRISEGDPQWPQIAAKTSEYRAALKKFRWRDHVVAAAPYSFVGLLLYAVGLILLLPIHLYGVINSYIPYKIPDIAAKKIFKDDHFHSSVKAAGAIFTFPILYLIQTGIVWALSDLRWALIYLVSLPLTGNLAYWYSVWVKKWYSRWSFSSLLRKKNPEVLMLVENRKMITEYLEKITTHLPETAKQ